jgi:hypothetical protein
MGEGSTVGFSPCMGIGQQSAKEYRNVSKG